jgi:hypothetical protein
VTATFPRRPNRALTRKRDNVDFMQRLLKMALAIVSLLLISTFYVSACSLARGYFYQITALRGRVVGVQTITYSVLAG